MPTGPITFKISRLAVGESLTLSAQECEAMFAPGLLTQDGRRLLYGFADRNGCDVRWNDDHSIRFVKRPGYR